MIAILLAAALPAAPIEEKIPAPNGPPPYFLAGRFEKDALVLLMPQYLAVTEKRVVEVKEGTEVKKKEVTVTTYRVELKAMTFPLKEIKVFGTDGKALDAKALAERLKKDTPVLVAGDDKPVDRFYLQGVKENTVIVVLPPPKVEVLPAEERPLEKDGGGDKRKD
jgi:hypothetical protein